MMDPCESNRVLKRCVKMTRKQASVLVEFMEANKEFAVGRYETSQKKTMMMKMWNELKGLLDMHGAPKTVDQWRRAWKDLRGKTRAKNARILAERSAAGLEESCASLSNVELKVLDIIGASTTAPAQKPSLDFESSQQERVKCVSICEESSSAFTVPVTPIVHQPPTPTVVRPSNNSRQAATTHKNVGSGRSKIVRTNDRLDDILSKLEAFRAESLEVMKVIANGITTLAQNQRDILIIQKERLEFQREILKLERRRVENQSKVENMLTDVVECQRRMASAQEQRAYFNLVETRHEEV